MDVNDELKLNSNFFYFILFYFFWGGVGGGGGGSGWGVQLRGGQDGC